MEINPSVIVQSSIALIVAMTSMEVVKSGLDIVKSDIPHEMFKYRVIVLVTIILMTILIIKYFSTYTGDKQSSNQQIDIPPYNTFTPSRRYRL